jgi:hypothetical protein
VERRYFLQVRKLDGVFIVPFEGNSLRLKRRGQGEKALKGFGDFRFAAVLSHEDIRDMGSAKPLHSLYSTQVEVERFNVRNLKGIAAEKLAHSPFKRFMSRLLKDSSWDIHQGRKVTEVFVEKDEVLPAKIGGIKLTEIGSHIVRMVILQGLPLDG